MIKPKEIVDKLIKDTENEVVEFKEAAYKFDFDKLGQYFSALSNEANLKQQDNAWLCFGIKDKDKSLTDTRYKLKDDKLQRLKGEISEYTTEHISFKEIFDFKIKGKRVILFQISPSPQGMPIGFRGHYYAREHDRLTPLNIRKIEQIRAQITIPDWSEKICKDATLDDLQLEAIEKARNMYQERHKHLKDQINSWDNKTFLDKAKITIRGKITNTAILLLGKPESTHFISPAVSRISWILKSEDGRELDYEHFTSPLIISIDKIYSKIRNIKYRYIKEADSIFPEEIDSYDPYIIREALNNCIAHQDYSLGGKINVVENQNTSLIFANMGEFLPITIENVIQKDAPALLYRNTFLTDAMVNLGMIDTIGSGIKNMFIKQKNRFFPLPDYDFTENQVKLTIMGKIPNLDYARKLAQIPDLDLDTIILLDKVQKQQSLTKEEAKSLRIQGLIEGRRPNIHISPKVASSTKQQIDYMKLKGADDAFCREQILNYLKKYKSGTKKDFTAMLIDKLSERLTLTQKENKIKNILQSLRHNGRIQANNDKWILK